MAIMLCFIMNIFIPFAYAEDIEITINEESIISNTIDTNYNEEEFHNEDEELIDATQAPETAGSEEINDDVNDDNVSEDLPETTEVPVSTEAPIETITVSPTQETAEEQTSEPTEYPEEEENVAEDVRNDNEYVIVMYEDENGQKIDDREVDPINEKIDVVKLDKGTDVYQYIEDEKNFNTNIKYIQPDHEMDLASIEENWSVTPNAEKQASFVSQDEFLSGSSNYDYMENLQIDSDIKEAMLLATGADTKIAVLDTEQLDFSDTNYDAWHGSMIRNIISYMAPETQIISYNLFPNGKGYVSDAIRAIIDCANEGVSIVNCSWTIDDESPVLEEVIRNSNMLFVCAAGNDRKDLDTDPVYPAAYKSENIITVGAVDANGMLCPYSNYSQNIIDITAQGDKITSITSDGTEYKSSGTSFASAFVTAVASMVYSADNDLSASELRSRIINGAEQLSTIYDVVNSGRFLNAKNAIEGTIVGDVTVLQTGVSEPVEEPAEEQIELYSNGGNDQWSLVGTTNTSRYDFATEVYNNRIYVMGGTDNETGEALNTVEVYDTISGTWTELSPMPHSRNNPKSILVLDKIYVFSGKNSDKAIDIYDINTNTWSTPMEFPYDNDGYAVGVKDNGDNNPPESMEIFVFGGNNTRNVYKYTISNDEWSQTVSLMSNMTDPRVVYAQYDISDTGFYLVDGSCNGRALSYNENAQYIDDTVEDLSGFSMAATPDLSTNDISNDFRIYITGGADINGENAVQSCSALYYNDAIYGSQVSWLGMQRLPEAMSYHGTEIVDGYMYVFGGKTSNNIYRISSSAAVDDEGYNISDDEWAKGSINNSGDTDYFTFTPSKSGWYTIDTGNSAFCAEFYMNDKYDAGDSEKGFCQYLSSGQSYPFRIKYSSEEEFCKRYELKFVYRNVSGMQNLSVGYDKTITCNNIYPEKWFKINSGNKISIVSEQPITVEKYMGDNSGKIRYNAGTNTISLTNDITGYLCITPTNGEWTSNIRVRVEGENNGFFEYSNMQNKRNKFEAMYLNGTIYVLGGYNENGVLTSAERYNTQDEEPSWQYISDMPKGALGFAAANSNDRIYIAGGYSNGQCISDLQIYDPANNTWTSGANMPEPRERCAAVICKGKLYVIGGRNSNGLCSSILVYDINADAWSEIGGLSNKILEPNVVAVNNAIYVFGGFTSTGAWSKSAYKLILNNGSVKTSSIKTVPEIIEYTDIFANGNSIYLPQISDGQLYLYEYDTLLRKWNTIECGSMNNFKYYEMLSTNGEIYLLGGYDNDYSNTVYKKFTAPVETVEWSVHSNLYQSLNKTEPILINGEKYIIGGINGNAVKTIYKYDEENALWQSITSIPQYKAGFAVEYYNDCIYIMGGYGGTSSSTGKDFLNTVNIYNLSTKKWTTGNPIPTAKERMGSVLYGDKIYLFGGRNKNGVLTDINIYDIKTDSWSSGGNLPQAIVNMAVGAYGHNIVLAGGYSSEGDPLNRYYVYDVETKQFSVNDENDLIGGNINKIRGVNNLMFACKDFADDNVRFIIYDPESDSWGNTDLNTNSPNFDYVSYLADEDNVYYIGGYSVDGAENSDIVLSIEYSVPIAEIDYTETPSEISGEQTISISSGNTYIVSITATNMENVNNKIFTLDYDSSKLAVDDICAQTWGKDISVGSVQDTDIEIISVTDSQIKFKTNKTQSPVSGTVNMLRFNAIATGTATVAITATAE